MGGNGKQRPGRRPVVEVVVWLTPRWGLLARTGVLAPGIVSEHGRRSLGEEVEVEEDRRQFAWRVLCAGGQC